LHKTTRKKKGLEHRDPEIGGGWTRVIFETSGQGRALGEEEEHQMKIISDHQMPEGKKKKLASMTSKVGKQMAVMIPQKGVVNQKGLHHEEKAEEKRKSVMGKD